MFNPYQKWLGIPLKDQPPNHYRLLGLELFESDPEIIDGAADRQMAYVRQFQSGEQAAAAAALLSQLATARLCLLKAGSKTAYDTELRKQRGVTPDRAKPSPAMSRRLVYGIAAACGFCAVLWILLSNRSTPSMTRKPSDRKSSSESKTLSKSKPASKGEAPPISQTAPKGETPSMGQTSPKRETASIGETPLIGPQETEPNVVANVPKGPEPLRQPQLTMIRAWDGTFGRSQYGTFSSDGSQIVYSNENDVYLAETATGDVIRKFTGHLGIVCSASVSKDGRRIVSLGYDNTLRVWDAATATQLVQFRADLDPRYKPILVISEDASRIAFLSGILQDLTIVDATTNQIVLHRNPPAGLLWYMVSPDMKFALAANRKADVVFVNLVDDSSWKVLSGNTPVSFQLLNDGRSAILAGRPGWEIWDIIERKQTRFGQTTGGVVYGVAASGSGSVVACALTDGSIRLWKGSKEIYGDGGRGTITSVAFSPDGQLLLTGSLGRMAKITLFRLPQ